MIAQPKQLIDQYCIFQTESDLWAVAARSVREIVDTVPIVAVPATPGTLMGVCHIRNEFLPVVDLQGLVTGGTSETARNEFLIILNGSEGPWAVAIQRALSLQTLEIAITDVTDGQNGGASPLFGTATFGGQVVRVIDATALYRLATETTSAHWRGNDATLISSETRG